LLKIHRTLLRFGSDEPIAGLTRELGISDRTAGEALGALEDAGIVRLVTRRVRGRLWECPDMFDLVQGFEDGLRLRGSRGGAAKR
jgi:DNA-binding transcriptional ArsR family regulator